MTPNWKSGCCSAIRKMTRPLFVSLDSIISLILPNADSAHSNAKSSTQRGGNGGGGEGDKEKLKPSWKSGQIL